MKNKGVCEGCKYHNTYKEENSVSYGCSYIEKQGSSRLVQEMKNGGYKKDSCVCYTPGKRKKYIPRPIKTRIQKKEA